MLKCNNVKKVERVKNMLRFAELSSYCAPCALVLNGSKETYFVFKKNIAYHFWEECFLKIRSSEKHLLF